MQEHNGYDTRGLAGHHILLVTDHAGLGGTRTYAEQLTRLFCGAGAKVTIVITGEFPVSALDLHNLSGECSVIHYTAIVGRPEPTCQGSGSMNRLRSLLMTWREQKAFERFVQDQAVDRVLVSVGRPGSLMGAARSQVGSIYILHTYPHGWKNVIIGWLFYGRQVRRDTTLVTVSDFAKQRIQRSWGLTRSPKCIQRIYSTAGPSVVLPGRKPGPISILTVGGVEDFKDPFAWIDLAVSVAHSLGSENVIFTWLGSGSLLEECRQRAHEVADRVEIRFVGATSEVASYYDAADIYIQSSRVESLGLAVLDATRRGIPCLVTSAGGLPEIIQNGINGYVVKSLRLPETVRLLISMSVDDQVTANMAQDAIRTYQEKFAPELWAEQVLTLIPEVR